MKVKRKLLIAALFDIGTLENTSQVPSLCIYIYPDDTIQVKLRYGFGDLPMYEKRVNLDMIKGYSNVEIIKEQCVYFLNSIMPNYVGEGIVTDIYLSPLFHEIMFRIYGFHNIEYK